jgi:hypothetical protein
MELVFAVGYSSAYDAVGALPAAFSFGSGLTAEEREALHRSLFPTKTNLQPRK